MAEVTETEFNDYLDSKFPGVKGTTEPEPATGAGGELTTEQLNAYLEHKFSPRAEKK